MAAGRLDAAAAQRLGDLDEAFQNQLWSEDAEAAARRARVGAELRAAERFMRLVSGEPDRP
jgi:chaperone required for assembly of F1-ATPase